MKYLRTSAIFVSGSALALCLALSPLTRAQQSQKPVADTFGDKPSPDNTIQPTADHPTAQTPGAQPAAATTPAKTETPAPAAKPDMNNRESTASNASTAATAEIQVAGKDSEEHTDRKLAGHKVEGSDGKDLGNINDFLVDPSSGRVEYAVISTGGLGGIGDKLRVVPLSELKAGDKDNQFRLGIDKASWDQIAAMSDDAFKAEKITFTDAERRQITGHFSAGATATADTSAYTAGLTSHLVRASTFHRREVRASGRDIGTIESLVIDLGKGTATALFDAKRDFAGTSQKFLVPLQQFAFSSAKEPAVTSLSRDDLSRAAGSLTSSSSTGTLPVSAPASTDRSTSTQANVAQSSTASTTPTAASDTTVSRASSSTAPSPGTTTSDQSLTVTGRDANRTAQGDTQAKSDQANAATTSTATDRSTSSVASADKSPSSATSTQANVALSSTTSTAATADAAKSDQTPSMTGRDASRTAQSDPQAKSENTAHPSATDRSSSTLAAADQSSTTRATNNTATTTEKQSTPATTDQATIASAQTDAQTVTRTPANRNEQGQDVATTVPASPSSKSPGADLAANATTNTTSNQAATTDATQQSATSSTTSVAANSTPSRSATGTQSISTEPTLTPTGQTSADQMPANADPALVSAALAIRKALDANPALARLDVSVMPQNGKLMLRGSVATNQLKTSVEQTAEQAASGKEIDSQLTVETK
jgi:sporulation protein YlmC with PRC-barrel domain